MLLINSSLGGNQSRGTNLQVTSFGVPKERTSPRRAPVLPSWGMSWALPASRADPGYPVPRRGCRVPYIVGFTG